jgi:hypothetical protein
MYSGKCSVPVHNGSSAQNEERIEPIIGVYCEVNTLVLVLELDFQSNAYVK